MTQFRTKARAVELLGKGQIADLPTAISELWKKGYDAYADQLSCNLYLPGYKENQSPIFTLSDNGFGMSRQDILNKWIVLGTDSKARGRSYLTDEERFKKKVRIPMGEKGIGRLSVAYLGSPMLMLTKKKEEKCQLLFIDWRILENYNLFIDDINVPLAEFSSANEFSLRFIEMQADFQSNLDESQWRDQQEQLEAIMSDVESLIIPRIVTEEIIPNFLDPNYHGTTFLIFQPNEQLLELADCFKNEDIDAITEMRRSLSGIYNVFAGKPNFSTNFNIMANTGTYDIINDFFNHEDFNDADHYIKGKFDENGLFTGIVRVFKETYNYTFRPIRVPGKTPYGPFELELSVLEGAAKNSILTPEKYHLMDTKTEKFGGLYIYRDNFRVLPYGRIDYDFLKFEERRNRKAGYYFFSHRNIFGYIAIGREQNPNLIDKAGREGLIENKAYREFKKDLIDFFVTLAMVYFRSPDKKDPNDKNAHSEQLKEIQKRNAQLLEAEKKKAKLTKAKFIQDLQESEEKIIILQKEIQQLCNQLNAEGHNLTIAYNNYNELVSLLENKKTELRALRINKPQRANLSSAQERKYETYRTEYVKTEDIIKFCDNEVSKVRKRFDLQNLKLDYEKRYTAQLREISLLVTSYKKRFETISSKFNTLFKDEQMAFSESFKEEVHSKVDSLNTLEEYDQAISNIIQIGEECKNQIEKRFAAFINHIENLSFDIDDDFLIGWYKEQKENLEDKLDATNELAQLGISVEINDHEFNVLYSQMANSINFLKEYALNHTEIKDHFLQLQTAFQHMETNYKLLQPLYRTTRRQKTAFDGEYLIKGMKAFFASKFSEHKILLEANDEFLNYQFFTYEPVITSVFINIINNAIYWLIPALSRKIRIEYLKESNEILIINNGEKIDDKMLADIFTLFFTRKKGGRGIGLYLARKSLRSIDYDIFATNDKKYNKLNGACFVIHTFNKQN